MDSLVSYLVSTGALRTPEIIQSFQAIDRADFVLEKYRSMAYEDIPLPIGEGQTISQPTTVAFMLELLQPKKGEKVLDIGSGSGWTTALLAEIVGRKGRVYGVEIIPQLVAFGKKNIKKYVFPQASILQAKDMLGYNEEAPYDKILISAASQEVPQEIIDQLVVGGRIVLPVANSLWRIDKEKDGKIIKKEYPGFLFVPLVY